MGLIVINVNRMSEEHSNSQPIVLIDRELEMVVITSHTIRRCKKKCGREDVAYNLVKELLDFKMSLENFNETLNSLIESKSIIVIRIRNQKCLSLPKENQHASENEEYQFNEGYNNFKKKLLEEFNHSKRIF